MKLLCYMGIHRYEMFMYAGNKGRFLTMGRDCKWCGKKQIASRPEKYHPTLYIWKDE